MKIPLSWLQEFVDINLPIESLTEALTMAGLEVASVDEIWGEPVFDIEITPNRADCLSIIGIAREIKALFRLNLKKPSFQIKEELKDDKFKIDILEPQLCFRYAGRIIRGIKVGNSPEWLRKRLEQGGIRSINNVVDVTNYVLLEYGHPLHAFDLNLLEGYTIKVGTLRGVSGKQFDEIETLDGVKRKITGDDLLIWDGKRPIAVAGVMGGANTEVTEKTVNIIIESAYFKPESIRRTSKRLGLSTEASYRFERGTDIENLIEALNRAAYLISNIAGGEVYELIDVYPNRIAVKEVAFKPDNINRFLGITLKEEEILEILHLLEFDVKNNKDFYVAKVPSHRQDISIEEDIAEEVARIYGYDKVTPQLPTALKPVEENHELSEKRKFINKIRDYMIALGFSEAVNMSFMSPEDLNLFEIPGDDRRRNFISLINPLRQEESIMRTMITPVLLKNIEKNSSRGLECLRIFEIARVFISKEDAMLPDEPVYLGIITKREDCKSPFNEDIYDFYALKGIIEGFIKHLKFERIEFVRSTEPFLHPGQSADLFVNDEKIGFIGVISPGILKKFGFKTKPYICIAEINLEKLYEQYNQLRMKAPKYYVPFSNYPSIKRDTAILVPLDFEAKNIFEFIKTYGSNLIEDVYIFDVYKGKGIPEGKQSIAFRITYRAFDRTLTSEEIDSIHSELIEKIISKTGAQLRF